MCCLNGNPDELTDRNEALWWDILPLAGLECFPGQQVRRMYRGTHMNMSAGSQHMKTIHIPKSMMSAPFLQVTSEKLEQMLKWVFIMLFLRVL